LNISSEAKVGITVLLAAIAAIVGFRFMSDYPILRQSQEVNTVFERIDGLSTGSQVFVRGVKVGSVSRVQLTETDSVRISMRLDMPRPLPRGSVAYLTSLGLIEGKSIVIELGDSPETVEFGEYIEGFYVETMMETLGRRGEDLGDDLSDSFTELNQFLAQLNEAFDDEARTSLNQTLQSTSSATERIASILENKQAEIDRAIDSGSSMLAQLDTLATDSRPRVDTLMVTLEKNIRDLEQIRIELEGATTGLNEIIDKINNGEGTLGKMVNDPAVYDNLDELTKELHQLVKGINENPGRYLRHMSIIDIF
jgi:phospholipid/cholesterol/gamma-HCH transport system substrate-binding protein